MITRIDALNQLKVANFPAATIAYFRTHTPEMVDVKDVEDLIGAHIQWKKAGN